MNTYPQNPQDLLEWQWPQIEPFYQELLSRSLEAGTIQAWLQDWSTLAEHVSEQYNRLYVGISANTADEEAKRLYKAFMQVIFPNYMHAEQSMKEKLLASKLKPDGFEIPLRNLSAAAALFRAENVPLQAQEEDFVNEYDRITGAQTVDWDGNSLTVTQLLPMYQSQDRALREKTWRLGFGRQLADRAELNSLWQKLLPLRHKIALNAGHPDYRSYRWAALNRFEYTPEDCLSFHEAILEKVVPAASRLYERRRQKLGLDTLRPWDLEVNPDGAPPLRPFETVDELKQKTLNIFRKIDPQLGSYFETMIAEDLLDLENRKNKAPGAYCTDFSSLRKPFIMANAVGINEDVRTVLHESGHAFHVFESAALPYIQQMNTPAEFAEVASMSMELLGLPHLSNGPDSFYNATQAAYARIAQLRKILLFWPYMSVVDSFQHWVYTHVDEAIHPEQCDAKWTELAQRFMPGTDMRGFEDVLATGWHRKPHIFAAPFYYIEYGLAYLGSVQVWGNSLRNRAQALNQYRNALQLGGNAPIPELYRAAGAKFAFDPQTLGDAVDLIESNLVELEKQI